MSTTDTITAAVTVTRRESMRRRLRASSILIALVAMIILFAVLRPATFLTVSNFSNVLDQVAILAIVATAQTIIMVVGDFDLSVGANASLAGVVVGTLLTAGVPLIPAILIVLVIGAAIGFINGALVVGFDLSAFVVTLATMTSVSGIAFLVTNGGPVYNLPAEFTALGQARIGTFPILAFFSIAVAVIAFVVLWRTVVGREWYAVGGSPEVSRLSGIDVGRLRILAFAVGGAVAALGGILLASRLGSATPTTGDSYTLLSVAAVFLGMTLSQQGVANVPGTLVGVVLLGVLANGLGIIGVNSYIQQVLTGVIIIASVTVSRFGRRRRRRT